MNERRTIELSNRDPKRSKRAKRAAIQRRAERRAKWQAQGRDTR